MATKMDIDKGTFQTMKPPNIYGSNRYLEGEKEWHSTISYDANIGKNKTIPLVGLTNKNHWCTDGKMCLQENPANINYRLIENTIGFQYSKVFKTTTSSLYVGGGGGVQNFPYGFITLSYNKKI